MSQTQKLLLSVAPLATALGALAPAATAQGLFSTSGVVVANGGDTIPDTTGAPISGLTFLATSSAFGTQVVDDAGHVFFRGRFQGTGVNTWDDTAYFYGTSTADLKMVLRGGDQAPGLGAGVLLRSSLGSSSTLTPTVQIASNGFLYWGVLVFDQPGTNGITSSNDDLLYGGLFSGTQGILVQQGSQLPSPSPLGTTYAQAFASPSSQSTGINAGGQVFFMGTTTGGDTSTTAGSNNQTGIFTGTPGAIEQVMRKSYPVLGLGGEYAIDTSATLGFVTQINASGNLLYETILSTTQGSPMATPTNDRVLMVYTYGGGAGGSAQLLVREGDNVPGTFDVGSSTFATYNTITGSTTESWSPGMSGNAFTNSGKALFTTTLRGGDVVGTTNDFAIMIGGVGSLSIAARKGDAAPGTDGTFNTFNNTNCGLNDSGRVMLEASITGGTVTTANDSGIWVGFPGSLQKVVREGDVMAGTGGSTAGNFGGTSAYYNGSGRVVFTTTLAGGTVTGTSWWVWGPNSGLQPLLLAGDVIEVSPSVFKTVSSAVISLAGANGNGDGGQDMFTNSGQFTGQLTMSDSTRVIMRIQLPPETPSTAFCTGDVVGVDCLGCGNNGAAGRGCANSSFASGGLLTNSGFSSVSLDSMTLTASDIPGPGLFFQATATGTINPFGDGMLCASTGIVRMGVVFPDGFGVATYPGGLTPAPIGTFGATAGSLLHYQCWYRDAVAFCTSATFNTTNGISLTWAP